MTSDYLAKLKQLLENASLDDDTRRDIMDTIAACESDFYRRQYELLRFLAIEYRIPMTTIQGYSRVLIDEMAGPVNSQQSEFLKIIRTHADGLLSNLHLLHHLGYTKLYDVKLNPKPVKVCDIADQTRQFCAQNDIRLLVHCDVDTGMVSIDSVTFKGLVQDLLSPLYPDSFLTCTELNITQAENVIRFNFVLKEDSTFIETFTETYHKLVEQGDNLRTFQDIYLSLVMHLSTLMGGKLHVEDSGDDKLNIVLEFEAISS